VTDLDPQTWAFSVKKPVLKKYFCLKTCEKTCILPSCRLFLALEKNILADI
jgi:hypothetical protein